MDRAATTHDLSFIRAMLRLSDFGRWVSSGARSEPGSTSCILHAQEESCSEYLLNGPTKLRSLLSFSYCFYAVHFGRLGDRICRDGQFALRTFSSGSFRGLPRRRTGSLLVNSFLSVWWFRRRMVRQVIPTIAKLHLGTRTRPSHARNDSQTCPYLDHRRCLAI